MMKNTILEQLEIAKTELHNLTAQIHDLERQRDIAEAKVEAFELSATYMKNIQATKGASRRKGGKRARMPSSDWKRIFQVIFDEYTSGFGYDQILRVAQNLEIDVKRASLRTKIMNYVNSGYVMRVTDGIFILTDDGENYFDLLTNEKGPEESGPNSILGASLARERGYPPSAPEVSIPSSSTSSHLDNGSELPPAPPIPKSDDEIPF